MTHPFRTQTTRTLHNSSPRGSFYESLPNFIESVQKPPKDDILKLLNECTKSDKRIDWRMRTRYEGACCAEFDDLLETLEMESDERSPRADGRRKDVSADFRGEARHRGQNHKSTPRSYLALQEEEQRRIRSANTIREQCRRRGDLYGPAAIAAVTGRGVKRSSVLGSLQSSWDSRYHHDTNYQDTINQTDATPTSLIWTRNRPSGESSPSSSITSTPRRPVNKQKLYTEPTSNCHHQFSSKCNASKLDALMKNASFGSDTTSASTKPEDNAGGSGKSKICGLGKVNLEIGVHGGDQVSSRQANNGADMKSNTRRPLRRRQKGAIKKQKSVSRVKIIDKRHKGPKIHGFKSWTDSIGGGEPQQIRTVALPYPQPKYRHKMNDQT